MLLEFGQIQCHSKQKSIYVWATIWNPARCLSVEKKVVLSTGPAGRDLLGVLAKMLAILLFVPHLINDYTKTTALVHQGCLSRQLYESCSRTMKLWSVKRLLKGSIPLAATGHMLALHCLIWRWAQHTAFCMSMTQPHYILPPLSPLAISCEKAKWVTGHLYHSGLEEPVNPVPLFVLCRNGVKTYYSVDTTDEQYVKGYCNINKDKHNEKWWLSLKPEWKHKHSWWDPFFLTTLSSSGHSALLSLKLPVMDICDTKQ